MTIDLITLITRLDRLVVILIITIWRSICLDIMNILEYKTRGGKYGLILRGDKNFYHIDDLTDGRNSGGVYNIKSIKEARKILNNRIKAYKEIDGINLILQ